MKRPAITMCHENMNGTGTALRLELHPARPFADGSILATIAQQASTTPASFEWDNSISVRLCLMDLAKVLQVFRGQSESISDGKGLIHRTASGCTIFRLSHHIEPVGGYVLNVSSRPYNGDTIFSMSFAMTYDEAFAICEAIDHAMLYVAFGVPVAD